MLGYSENLLAYGGGDKPWRALTFELDARLVLAIITAVFGIVGVWRGVSRELITLAGIIVANVVVRWGGRAVVTMFNRFYVSTLVAIKSGLDPTRIGPAFEEVQRMGPLINSQRAPIFLMGLFAFVVLFGYAVGQEQAGPPKTWPANLIGGLAGLVNGYLIIFYALPSIVPATEEAARVTVQIPVRQVMELVQDNWIYALVAIVVLIIVQGLRASS